MPSFDVVSEVDKQEIKNAIDQVNKEVKNRFDFKGSDARIEAEDFLLTVYADDEFKLGQVLDILRSKLTKRQIDVRCMEIDKIEAVSGNKAKLKVTIKNGLDIDLAKKITKLIKETKLKAQGSIQGKSVRVTSAKRDVLQEVMQLIKKNITEMPVQFQNFRD